MKIATFLAAGAVAATLACAANAQTVGLGITKGTAVDQMGAAIAKVVSQYSGLQMRTQAMAGTQKYIQVVNGGDLEFGIANLMQTYMAWTGTGVSEGHKFENLRLVATLMAFRNCVLTPAKENIKTSKDLKGHRMAFGFNGAPLFRFFMRGALINGGLSYDDVTKVPAVGLAQSWNLLKQGKLDGTISALGAGATAETNATIDGGARFIDLATEGPDAEKALKALPGVYYVLVQPAKALPGIEGPTHVFGYDFGLFANKNVKADVIEKVVKAIYDHGAEIKSTAAMWRTWEPKDMGKKQPVPYHPAAEAEYKKLGVWMATK